MAQTTAERAAQKSYWLEHSSQPTVEAMMLDSKASEIDQLERPEVRYECKLGSMHRVCNPAVAGEPGVERSSQQTI